MARLGRGAQEGAKRLVKKCIYARTNERVKDENAFSKSLGGGEGREGEGRGGEGRRGEGRGGAEETVEEVETKGVYEATLRTTTTWVDQVSRTAYMTVNTTCVTP